MLAFYQRVNEHNREAFAGRKPPPPPESGQRYVGVETCATCHAGARDVWQGTAHSHAYATLSRQFKEYNLDCVSCHVTGYERPGGSTVTENAALQNVQCESCHGPGSLHAADPSKKGAIVAQPDPQGCVSGCHHSPHVEGFDPVAVMHKVLGPGHGNPDHWPPKKPRLAERGAQIDANATRARRGNEAGGDEELNRAGEREAGRAARVAEIAFGLRRRDPSVGADEVAGDALRESGRAAGERRAPLREAARPLGEGAADLGARAREPAQIGENAEELLVGEVLAAEQVALAEAAPFEAKQDPPGDVVDVDDAEATLGAGEVEEGDAVAQEAHDERAEGARAPVARAEGGGGQGDDEGQALFVNIREGDRLGPAGRRQARIGVAQVEGVGLGHRGLRVARAEGQRARDVGDARDAPLPGGLEHFARAGLGLFGAALGQVSQGAHRRRRVHQPVAAGERTVNGVADADVALFDFEPPLARAGLEGQRGQPLPPLAARDEGFDRLAGPEQLGDEASPEELARPRDENFALGYHAASDG
ncbi:MAG: cytochrome c family protein [Polyangiaceae bacterium]|nr:cytochrome c family protein [Polyangiaceae bacterium]